MNFKDVSEQAALDPGGFWLEAARDLDWSHFPTAAYDTTHDIWFPDGRINTCFNAVDRHVDAGRGASTALIYESPVTGTSATFTFAELQEKVAQTAGMIAAAGVARGDRVVIYMPMIPEAVFAILACARIGAVHSVVFGGFAAPELAKRIDDCEPVLVLSASCGFEPGRTIVYKPLLDDALRLARHKPPAAIIFQREELPAELTAGRDRDWAEAYAEAPPAPCLPLASHDPLYILYTSGTTGAPKGVVRDNGGHAVALHWSMRNIYGVEAGDVFWAASDIGWVVGHSYIVYGPLLKGCATILFEGKPVGTPGADIFWRLVDKHRVNVLFTAPTAIRAIRRADPEGRMLETASRVSLRALFLAGEYADPDTLRWIAQKLGVPVVDHWWQTELGWPAIATCTGLGERETRFGSAGHAVPGYRFKIQGDDGSKIPVGISGNLLIERPLPPGAFRSLWKNPEAFEKAFADFPGHYRTGDAGMIDPDGFIHLLGRTDDIINVAGHRLSTSQIEEIVARHPHVIECAFVGAADKLKGEMPMGFVVTRPGAVDLAELRSDLTTSIRGTIGPIASPRAIVFVEALPRTRSGKTLRKILRDVVNGVGIDIPQTIEDPVVVAAVVAAARQQNSGLTLRPAASESVQIPPGAGQPRQK